jgi:hypothetical protein
VAAWDNIVRWAQNGMFLSYIVLNIFCILSLCFTSLGLGVASYFSKCFIFIKCNEIINFEENLYTLALFAHKSSGW